MAVTSCYPAERSLTLDLKGTRQAGTAQVPWLIETDVAQGPIDTYTQAIAVTSPMIPLPQRGATYDILGESDNGLVVLSLKFKQLDRKKRKAWVCTVDYGPFPAGTSATADFNPIPWERPIKYTFESQFIQEPAIEAILLQDIPDFLGLEDQDPQRAAGIKGPIVNAFLADYDETIMVNRRQSILVATRNINDLATSEGIAHEYQGSVNSDPIFGVSVGEARFHDRRHSDEINENGYVYWRQTTYVELKLATVPEWGAFHVDIVNRGWGYWEVDDYGEDTASAQPFEVAATADPVLLTAEGRKLGKDEIGNTIPYRTELKTLAYVGLGIGTAYQ